MASLTKLPGQLPMFVHSGAGSSCAIIDSVLDYDPKSGRTRTDSAQKVIDYVKANDLRVEWILETHAHADHLSAAPFLKRQLRRQNSDWKSDYECPEGIQGHLQSGAGVQAGWLSVRYAVCRRSGLPGGAASRQGTLCAGSHASLHGLSVR